MSSLKQNTRFLYIRQVFSMKHTGKAKTVKLRCQLLFWDNTIFGTSKQKISNVTQSNYLIQAFYNAKITITVTEKFFGIKNSSQSVMARLFVLFNAVFQTRQRSYMSHYVLYKQRLVQSDLVNCNFLEDLEPFSLYESYQKIAYCT